MTISETYKYLESVRRIESEIRKQQLKHDALESCLLPKAITYDKDAVQTSPEDKISEIAAEVSDIEAKLRSLVVMKRRTIHDVSMSIANLDSDAEQIVLLGFFVGGLSAQRIAETVHYTVRSVYRLKRRAVRNLSIKLSQMSQ